LGLVNNFNTLPADQMAVFLLSTKAAGEGLNLHSANRVVMFDCCWNPCLDHEAMCRAYRFGQKKNVYVYRLIAAGTMERNIFNLQSKKEALTYKIVDAKASKRMHTVKDLKDFFDLRRFNRQQKDTVSLPSSVTSESLQSQKHEPLKQNDENVRKSLQPDDAEAEVIMHQALSKDTLLQTMINAPKGPITSYSLENLSRLEDESEKCSPAEQEHALKMYEEEIEFAKSLVAIGWTQDQADLEVARRRSLQQPLKIEKRQTTFSKQLAESKVNLPQIGIFHGFNFLILRRRMNEKLLDLLLNAINSLGGNIVMEVDPQTHFVITSWSSDQINKWLIAINRRWVEKYGLNSNGTLPLRPAFPTWKWILNCRDRNVLLPYKEHLAESLWRNLPTSSEPVNQLSGTAEEPICLD